MIPRRAQSGCHKERSDSGVVASWIEHAGLAISRVVAAEQRLAFAPTAATDDNGLITACDGGFNDKVKCLGNELAGNRAGAGSPMSMVVPKCLFLKSARQGCGLSRLSLPRYLYLRLFYRTSVSSHPSPIVVSAVVAVVTVMSVAIVNVPVRVSVRVIVGRVRSVIDGAANRNSESYPSSACRQRQHSGQSQCHAEFLHVSTSSNF
jgi:hypothetical protein